MNPGLGLPPAATTPAQNSPVPSLHPTDIPVVMPEAMPEFNPRHVESTAPELFLSSTDVMSGGEIVESYSSDSRIDFGYGDGYTALQGVITFRGNNFRDGAAYGAAEMELKRFGRYWTQDTGSLTGAGGVNWSGSGWTGQPVIISWAKETRQIMNMYDWAKEKDELVEVIYATMDGYIYFMELESGSKTRDSIGLGFTVKGSASLDPRGYPLLYVGAGYDSGQGKARAFIVSLVDGSVLLEFGHNDGFALRAWPCFDSSPLVDAETDTLIFPGENGVLYLIKLNTAYDPVAGTISITPETVKWRYSSIRSAGGQFWLGMEASAVVWRGHLIIPDNGGHLICLDLNTLEVDWVQDVLDDTNCTPVLELEDGHPYVYVSTSFHYGWRSWNTADIPVWKIDAETGEIVWKTDYECFTVQDLSGGVQGTIALGKGSLSDLIFVPVARTGNASGGVIAALDKATGEVVWEFSTQIYCWSSPLAFYDQNGNGYVVCCTTGGYMYLLDGRTGAQLDSKNLGSNIEASPAIYNSTLVVGTRANGIWGITLN